MITVVCIILERPPTSHTIVAVAGIEALQGYLQIGRSAPSERNCSYNWTRNAPPTGSEIFSLLLAIALATL